MSLQVIKFSIIVPLYNKAPYIRKALETIVAQSCKDWECIIVEDGSTDESADLAASFITECGAQNKMHLVRQTNTGVAAARNNGVKNSQGEYLCFLDADDWWEPEFLTTMTQMIADYPQAGLYATNYVYYKPGKTRVALHMPTGLINYPQAYGQSSAMPIWTGAVCMPRNVFQEMGGFPEGIRLGEDFLLWSRVALRYPIMFMDKPLAYYNNAVPAALRATHNLHAPQYHMLWNMGYLAEAETRDADWKQLCDRLRVDGLREYWLDRRWHAQAENELQKVDWSRQPASVVRWYGRPLWMSHAERDIMRMGSTIKQMMIRLLRYE